MFVPLRHKKFPGWLGCERNNVACLAGRTETREIYYLIIMNINIIMWIKIKAVYLLLF